MTDEASREPGLRAAIGELGRENGELRREIERLQVENGCLLEDYEIKRERIEALTARTRFLTSRLENEAATDELTGLTNRRALESLLAQELSRAARRGEKTVAVLIGADETRRINEALGHSSGDVVLKGMATRMKHVLRDTDPLCRIGGDEFLALLSETRLADGVQVAERMRRAIADHPLEIAGKPLQITASLSVALVPATVVSIEEVLDTMRAALMDSKREGRDRVVLATDDTGRRTTRADDEDEFDQLLERGTLNALAQSIRSLTTGEVTAYEMLSRGPEGPYHSPIDLFRLAQERGAMTLLDLRCFRTCVQLSSQLPEDLSIHVNILPSTLVDTPADRILELFAAAGGPSRFCIELSEQQFLGAPDYLFDAVHTLKREGVRMALDDVGFGRSSMEALVMLEPDVIKLARECVESADRFVSRRRALERLVHASYSLADTLVAEGIEREGERRVCAELGIQHGQGFLWDRPRSVEDLERPNRRMLRTG